MKTVSKEFRRARRKIGLRKIGFKLLIITTIAGLIEVIIFFIQWYNFDSLPPLTEKDIINLCKLDISYYLSGWWNFLFSWLWVGLVYLIFYLKILKRWIGAKMRNIFGGLVIAMGIYFTVTYGAIFYGFIFSITFILIFPLIIIIRFLIKDYILAGL